MTKVTICKAWLVSFLPLYFVAFNGIYQRSDGAALFMSWLIAVTVPFFGVIHDFWPSEKEIISQEKEGNRIWLFKFLTFIYFILIYGSVAIYAWGATTLSETIEGVREFTFVIQGFLLPKLLRILTSKEP